MDAKPAVVDSASEAAVVRVLLVGDGPVNLLHMPQLLRKLADCIAHRLTDPVQALAWSVEDDADVAIVDYMMPEVDGPEFARRLRAFCGDTNTPLLMVTSGGTTIIMGDEVLPARLLAKLFSCPSWAAPPHGVPTRSATTRSVLVVDGFGGRGDVVIEPLQDIKPKGGADATFARRRLDRAGARHRITNGLPSRGNTRDASCAGGINAVDAPGLISNPTAQLLPSAPADNAMPLKVLCVDDCEIDAHLIVETLKHGGYAPVCERVCTREAVIAALERHAWDAVICDDSMPQFDVLAVLTIFTARALDIPFILVSGAIGEDTAMLAMKSGASNYIMRQDLGRLVPIMRRELFEADMRRGRRLAEANLRSSETLLNSIVNTAVDGIIVIDDAGILEFANAAVERMFGWKPLELIGRNIDCLMPARHRNCHQSLIADVERRNRALASGVGHEVKARRKNGTVFSIELTFGEMRLDGRIKYTGIMRDVTERKCAEERIRHLAHYDELTGLPNRALFSQLLGQALSESKFAQKQVAILFIDLDRFKLINDSLSHALGDTVLQQMAKRLTEALPRRDTIARFGGDEFVVLMRDCKIPADAAETAQNLLTAVAQPLIVEGQEYHLTASIGISAFPGDGENGQTLLKHADIAMYRAKEHGKNNYQFYSSQMNLHSFERLVLERFLRHALEQNEFEVYYQPKIDLVTGCVTGMEALLRWIHPGMGMILPAKFIPLAEETGLIVPIGAWVLRAACAQNQVWQQEGLPPLRVAVNLSACQFAQDDLHATVVAVLKETGLAPELLELEITESVTMDSPKHAETLLNLKALGIRLAIDDFGTGYSSLSYLKRFPIDNVKIDRSFIKGIPDDEDDVAITQAVIAMAHSLRLKVIAEGVESEQHLAFLCEHDCDEAQGYLFGAPMPATEFRKLLARCRDGAPLRTGRRD